MVGMYEKPFDDFGNQIRSLLSEFNHPFYMNQNEFRTKALGFYQNILSKKRNLPL